MAAQQYNGQSQGQNRGGGQPSQGNYDREGPSVEISPGEDGACIAASSECGEVSTDICDGCTTLICAGPAVGCDMACGSDEEGGVNIENGCMFSLCGTSCIFGCCLLTLGLALDSKVTWSADNVEFEVLGTGIDTKEGIALNVLGSQIGIVDQEKRQKYEEKKQKRREGKRN